MLQNLSTSSIFNDNAIKFYDNVANYVDSQKIEYNITTSDLLSNTIYIELAIIYLFV